MKNIEKLIIAVAEGYANDYGVEGLLEELFPDMTIGELIVDMYNAGLIPEDALERFLNDE